MEWVKVTNGNCMRFVESFGGVETTPFTNEHYENGILARGDEESLVDFINENIWVNHLDELEGRSLRSSDFCILLFELGNGVSIEISNTVDWLLKKGRWAVFVKFPEGDEVLLSAEQLGCTLSDIMAEAKKCRGKEGYALNYNKS